MPEMTYSSDIIVGFPGETEEDFCATEALIREVEYMQLFTFIYSKRTGTAAASMPDPTPHKEKTQRIARVLAIQEQVVANWAAQWWARPSAPWWKARAGRRELLPPSGQSI